MDCPICSTKCEESRDYMDYQLMESYSNCPNGCYSSEWAHGSGRQYFQMPNGVWTEFHDHHTDSPEEHEARIAAIKNFISKNREQL